MDSNAVVAAAVELAGTFDSGTTSRAMTTMASKEVTVRLSVRDLRELIERAEDENYMIIQDARTGRWVRLIPYIEQEENQS